MLQAQLPEQEKKEGCDYPEPKKEKVRLTKMKVIRQ